MFPKGIFEKGFFEKKSADDNKSMHAKSLINTRGYKTFSCSTQLSIKFIMLINVKMLTIVGILKFISMVNKTSESLKARSLYFSAI